MSKLRSSSSLLAAFCIAVGAPGLAAAQPKASTTAPPPVAAPPLPAPKAAAAPVAPAKSTPPPVAAPPLAGPQVAPPPVGAPPLPSVGAPTKVAFGPAAPGTGSVVVKGDNMKVSFDGRPMGTTPLTITDIPKGDYIVEGTDASGKEVSRPVTIEEGAEANVDMGAGVIGTAAPGTVVVDEGHPRLLMASKVMLGVSAAALVAGAVFGVLELKQHSDYESAPAEQRTLDDMAHTGQRYALIANAGFVACGVSLIAAGALALPSYLKSGEHPAEPTTTAFISTGGARGGAMAGFSTRF
jgi:hypothetical protein